MMSTYRPDENQFVADNKEFIDELDKISGWNQFAESLVDQAHRRGFLSPRQIEAGQRMLHKLRQKQSAPAKEQVSLDVSAIEELFSVAKGNGLGRPRLIVRDLRISEAGAHSRNAGALYVKDAGEYAGKIMNGRWMPVRNAREDIIDELIAIAKNPTEQVELHGRETGQCGCCGRELTDPNSIERGIGPVCASRWGL